MSAAMSEGRPARIAGLLLAAGSGRRFGRPKALVDTGDGPWVLRALRTLAGLDPCLVVVGAAAEQVTALLPDSVTAVFNPDHAGGMGSSLAAGLRALPGDVDAVVVMLVDLPDVPAEAVRRVVATAHSADAANSADSADSAGPTGVPAVRATLARAGYRGTIGHPVLIGADHIAGVLRSATGDRGARDYLSAHPVTVVECGDLAGGADVDTPPPGRPAPTGSRGGPRPETGPDTK